MKVVFEYPDSECCIPEWEEQCENGHKFQYTWDPDVGFVIREIKKEW